VKREVEEDGMLGGKILGRRLAAGVVCLPASVFLKFYE